jgi:hypothetical protein
MYCLNAIGEVNLKMQIMKKTTGQFVNKLTAIFTVKNIPKQVLFTWQYCRNKFFSHGNITETSSVHMAMPSRYNPYPEF